MILYSILLAASLAAPAPLTTRAVSAPAVAVAPLGTAPIKRGAPLGTSPVVALADILKNPAAYADKPVTLEGVVHAVCTRKGCWMEISEKKGNPGLRVTFKDYGFFVPTNSKGMKVRAEGHVIVETMSKEDVDHYVSEGASIDRNADGTATEVRFVADGVELRKK